MSYKKPVHNLDIGSHVVCIGVFCPKHNVGSQQRRKRERYRTRPKHGWLVGWRTILTDWELTEGTGYAFEEDPPEPTYQTYVSKINGQERVALVLFWPTHRPRYVPINAITPHDKTTDGLFAPSSGMEWTEHDKQNMREWSKDFPRDEHGRFCKKKIS